MATFIEITEVINIINTSDLEDALILNTNYTQLLDDLPDGDDKTRVIILRRKTQKRIKELKMENTNGNL